ncbi:MAG: hypothetical protein MUD03_04235 [Pirellula sp.]|jgi:hypothetical protein|nr:hypothetical protein [Pirellula sp.]
MANVVNFVSGMLEGLWKGISYSVEHMTVTQWGILGTASVVVGFMLLRTQRF